MYINKIIILSIINLILSIELINGHGYSIYPIARQLLCSKSGSIWYPEDGSGLTSPACRAAFTYVNNKGNSPQYQFVQTNEYSVLIPNYAQGASALKAAVPNALCSANAITSSNDKSGMSVLASWGVTTIPTTQNAVTQNITYKFCATAVHVPSYWEFYVSKPGYNPATQELTWANVQLFQTITGANAVSMSDPNCGASKGFVFNLALPTRFANAVLLVRWQRVDPVGESFINCSDFKCVAK